MQLTNDDFEKMYDRLGKIEADIKFMKWTVTLVATITAIVFGVQFYQVPQKIKEAIVQSGLSSLQDKAVRAVVSIQSDSAKAAALVSDMQCSKEAMEKTFENYQKFLISNEANNNDLIRVPSGNVDDWNIVLAPKSMGIFGDDLKNKTSLVNYYCFAMPQKDKKGWLVKSLFQHRDEKNQIQSNSAPVFYVIFPK